MRAIAINIGANTNEPGFRGPVSPEGSFEYIPIPESAETGQQVPTYGGLASHLDTPIPADLTDTPVHLDPEFPEYPFCERYTYGDEHGVKAGPLSSLAAGDYVFFYATLSVTERTAWLPPTWGAFIIGQFRLARDPLCPEGEMPLWAQEAFRNNAHCKREPPDAEVLLLGDPDESSLYDRAVPLSQPSGGTDANDIVTSYSADSGKGPWWRRPLRFDEEETTRVLERIRDDTWPDYQN